MREWNLTGNIPLHFLLTPEAHLCQSDCAIGHSWQLSVGDSNRSFIGIHSTLGLKVIDLNLFLAFGLGNRWISDPSEFVSAPTIKAFSSCYLRLILIPFPMVEVSLEFFITGAFIVCGRVSIFNSNKDPHSIDLGLFGDLITTQNGKPLTVINSGMSSYLQGFGDGVVPTIFMSGGPSRVISPKIGLALPLRILPNEKRIITWACSTAGDAQLSFSLAQTALKLDWEKEVAKMEHFHDASTLEIFTGNLQWDAVLATSQVCARQLVIEKDSGDSSTFVEHRSTETNFAHLSNTSLETQSSLLFNHLVNILLPGNATLLGKIAIQLLKQSEYQSARQLNKPQILPLPMLARTISHIAQYEPEQVLLQSCYPMLSSLIDAWLSKAHDQDQDGMPELSTATQLGFSSLSKTSSLPYTALTDGIQFTESPALAALIIDELAELAALAQLFGDIDTQNRLNSQREKLSQELKTMYVRKEHCFIYRDRDSHTSCRSKLLREIIGNTKDSLEINLTPPQRIMVCMEVIDQSAPSPRLFIRGFDENNHRIRVEIVFNKNMPQILVSEQIFSSIKSIETKNFDSDTQCNLSTFGTKLADITCLLPISRDLLTYAQLKSIVNNTILSHKTLLNYGIPKVLGFTGENKSLSENEINIPWNMLIIERLIDCKFIPVANQLFSKLMDMQVQTLAQYHAFFEGYDASNASPRGHHNALAGLIPLTVFLKLIGVDIKSPKEVIVFGEFPLLTPVKINFCGLSIYRSIENTNIVLPNGKIIRINDNKLHVIKQD